MRLRSVFWVLGLLLRPFSILLLIPAAVDFGYGNPVAGATFVAAALLAFLIALLLGRLRGDAAEMGRVEAMAVVANAWLMAALLGSIPYIQQGLSFVDGFFE